MSPFSHEVNAFVRLEDISVSLQIAGINRFEVARDMTTVVGNKVSRRVESVVVTRR